MKSGLLLVVMSLFVLVGCGNKPNKDVLEVMDAIVDDWNQSIGNAEGKSLVDNWETQKSDYTKEDLSFKIFYSDLLDSYAIHAFVPYVDRKGEISHFEHLYSYYQKELEVTRSVERLPSILTEGSYEEVYRSGKFDE